MTVNSPPYIHTYIQILEDLHWLPVKFRVKFKICLLVYQFINDCGPDYMREILEFSSRSRTLRSSTGNLLLQVPRVKTEYYDKRSFRYAGPKLWNELPYDIRSSDSLSNFKKTQDLLFQSCFKLNFKDNLPILIYLMSIYKFYTFYTVSTDEYYCNGVLKNR